MKSILASMAVIGLVLTVSADAAAAAAAGVDLNVAYCESTGAQYIDTGILGNPGLRVEAEVMWTETAPDGDRHILGSFDKINNGQTSWRCYPISMFKSRDSTFCFDEVTQNLWYKYTMGKKYRIVSDFGC